jgi:hypothetical protein
MDQSKTRFLCRRARSLIGWGRRVGSGLLGRHNVAVFLPDVHEFAVVVYGLEDGCVGQLLFQAAFTDAIHFLFGWVGENLHEFFFALWAVVGSVDHLFGVFDEDFYAVMGCTVRLVNWAHVTQPEPALQRR